MILITILAAFCIACAVVGAVGGVLKTIMEVVSFLTKFTLGIFVMLIVFSSLSIEFSSMWTELLAYLGGAALVMCLLVWLASAFRLVGYSINFFLDSLLVAIVATMLHDKISFGFIAYTAIVFLFPRLLWVSDRFSTITQYSHTKYNYWNKTQTDYYVISDFDWWGGTGDTQSALPFQIVLSCVFYLFGNLTILSLHPIESNWLSALFLILMVAANILFDIFVFSKVDNSLETGSDS